MEFNVKEGMNSTMEITVSENETAAKVGSGNLYVFSTPSMIALMENTAKSAVGLHLPLGFDTVGIEVSIKHLKSTPVGMKVRSEAVVTKKEGKKLTFSVQVWDEQGKIGEGIHIRYIINIEDFMKRVRA